MVVINAFIMDMKRKDVRSADKETGYVDNATQMGNNKQKN
uniref:Bm13094, isoform a n=1 Tax=Brugia malayi TaxID=6279 RepID=A0A1I9G227_BRUMA|nr:Bm13094, isoform a [Brugia malayi]